jgi:protein tyrosine/serine phosphatase
MEAKNMSQFSRWVNIVLLISLIVGGPLAYAKNLRSNFRNFGVVSSGVLYRSGQLSKSGLVRAIHDYGIRTVITLRAGKDPGDPAPDAAEEDYCINEQLNYVRLPYRTLAHSEPPWIKVDGKAPIDSLVAQFLDEMDNELNYPVLVHCFAGANRTGAFVAIYRMEYERWSNADAIAELKAKGYDNLEEHRDICSYMETYEPRWKKIQKAVLADDAREKQN